MGIIIQTSTIGMSILQKRAPVKKAPEMKITIPERGSAGPVRIGKLLEPLWQIINHPDRSRLIAELFKDYK